MMGNYCAVFHLFAFFLFLFTYTSHSPPSHHTLISISRILSPASYPFYFFITSPPQHLYHLTSLQPSVHLPSLHTLTFSLGGVETNTAVCHTLPLVSQIDVAVAVVGGRHKESASSCGDPLSARGGAWCEVCPWRHGAILADLPHRRKKRRL